MADQRLKGQEVQIQVTQDGNVVSAINAIASFNDTAKFEKKEDGFLGEVTNRYDTIFNGYDGAMSLHISDQGWMELQAAIKAKAQRAQPLLQFNIIRVDLFPNGQAPTRTYQDVEWGPMPSTVGSRGDFVTVDLDFSCSDVDDNLQGIL